MVPGATPRNPATPARNADDDVVQGFGDEWSRFDQSMLSAEELGELFDSYFGLFPWAQLPPGAVGADVGCGSGRWAKQVAPRVGRLICVDASPQAAAVARRNLAGHPNAEVHVASVDAMPIPDRSLDFLYSLGVLHHVPDTAAAIRACAAKLKPGAPFVVYLYYAFDHRPAWFRAIWRMSELGRKTISRLPHALRFGVTQIIAATVYWPLARIARALERRGRDVSAFPLSFYRDRSFYVMRTDALDRFGTRLEQRFTRAEIRRMLEEAGLRDIRFSDTPPYWTAIGFKSG